METTQIAACVDCLFFVEYGTVPEEFEREGNISEDIARIWHNDLDVVNGGVDCDACQNGECEGITFSWRACELCGSTLGGTRHHMTVFS